MTHEEDKNKRNEICRLLEESDIEDSTKERIKSFIERINNGDLEDMFNKLQETMNVENNDS